MQPLDHVSFDETLNYVYILYYIRNCHVCTYINIYMYGCVYEILDLTCLMICSYTRHMYIKNYAF